MKVVKKAFIQEDHPGLKGEGLEEVYSDKNTKCFIDETEQAAVITDKDNEVKFIIQGDCQQNTGFVSFHKPEEE